MQKTIFIPIDTTIKNEVECTKLIKRGDTLALTIKVFNNGILADFAGQSIDLILKKSDGTLIEKTITKVSNGTMVATLDAQATNVSGLVTGEIQIYNTDGQASSNIFNFKVDRSLADDVIEKSKDSIETLAQLKSTITESNNVIDRYKENIKVVAGTTEAVEALGNTKSYIDKNLAALDDKNAKATVNIINLKKENDRADINMPSLKAVNINSEALKATLEADIAEGNSLDGKLKEDIANAKTAKSNLETTISTSNISKSNLETVISNSITPKKNLEDTIIAANNSKSVLEKENTNAQANIETIKSFGDATQMIQNVTSIKTEIENARGTERNLDVRLNKVDTQLSDMKKDISNITITTPTISYGMNNVIKNAGKTSISPKFTIQGKTVVNLLGKDGNCEDTSKWTSSSCTSALDSVNKVFGSNGIKLTLTASPGYILKIGSTFNLDTTKYYLISGYLKNGNATSIRIFKDDTGGGKNISSSVISDTTRFTRVGMVVNPSELNNGNYFAIYVMGANGQYAYADGIMINEITSAEYALGTDALLAKYPYVDSYSCLQNPYIEVRRDNLVRNGNGEEGVAWWIPNNGCLSMSVSNTKFNITSSSSGGGSIVQSINIKPNTNYCLSGNINGDVAFNVDTAMVGGTGLLVGTGIFNSGSNSVVYLKLYVPSANQTGIVDSIMLIEGTTPPTEYKPCRIERCVIEGKFTSDDSITYENGKVTGLLNWKHKTLCGKDYDWQFISDSTGCKVLTLPYVNALSNIVGNTSSEGYGILGRDFLVKYDGKIVSHYSSNWLIGDLYTADSSNSRLAISVADTDTGWAENINPNNDEVKAFMNGWKAITCGNYRYLAWISIIDGSLPPNTVYSTISSQQGGTAIAVADSTKFAIGDWICAYSSVWTPSVITAISGNQLTLSLSVGTVVIGSNVIKCDVPGTITNLLNYCKNNVAPNYEGYQLHYKLQNPESITDSNCHIHGDIPKFDVGDNYLFLDNGIVLGEVANAAVATYAAINSVDYPNTLFKYKTEIINSIYKNNICDTIKWILDNNLAYGKQRAYALSSNFDNNATYTIDYKILATQAPQIGAIGCSYTQDIVSAINKLNEEMENRQQHDSTLDTLVDLSLYEKFSNYVLYGRGCKTDGTALYQEVPLSPKKAIPIVTILSSQLVIFDSNGIGYAPPSADYRIEVSVYSNHVRIKMFYTGIYQTNLQNYGGYTAYSFIADCRGRI